jgi:hypothetical protein
MDLLPGVPVTDAEPVEGLAAGPEPDARRARVGVQVAGHDHGRFRPVWRACSAIIGHALAKGGALVGLADHP